MIEQKPTLQRTIVTNYRATLIPLFCDETIVRAWAAYMRSHLAEVVTALRAEGVRHEMWFFGREDGPFIIGVIDVDDLAKSRRVSERSDLSVDEVHRRFKVHWDRARAQKLPIDKSKEPSFDGCELLFEARG